MTSFAATPGGRGPWRATRIVAGTFTRTSPDSHAHATSVVPIPNATQPSAPACVVCESDPTTTWPGSA
jgi:hypothetical protein